jgi:hypothetical protein
MAAKAEAAADDAARRAPSDWDASVAHRHLSRRVGSLGADNRPLCFGRIAEDGECWYIGRRHVEGDIGEPVVVDWRTPVAVPFYRATFRDPLGLHLRRRFILENRHISTSTGPPWSARVSSSSGPTGCSSLISPRCSPHSARSPSSKPPSPAWSPPGRYRPPSPPPSLDSRATSAWPPSSPGPAVSACADRSNP